MKAKKACTDQSTLQVFLLCPNRNSYKRSKETAEKKFFSSVYVIDETCFDEYFLFHVISRGRCFS